MEDQKYIKIDRLNIKSFQGFVPKIERKNGQKYFQRGFTQYSKRGLFFKPCMIDREGISSPEFTSLLVTAAKCFVLLLSGKKRTHPVESILSLVSINLNLIEDSNNSKASTKGLA